MFEGIGKKLHAVEERLAAGGLVIPLILKLAPVIVADILAGKTIDQIVADILAQFLPTQAAPAA